MASSWHLSADSVIAMSKDGFSDRPRTIVEIFGSRGERRRFELEGRELLDLRIGAGGSVELLGLYSAKTAPRRPGENS